MWQAALACSAGGIALASCVLDPGIVLDHLEEQQSVTHGVTVVQRSTVFEADYSKDAS